jgi:hypothetical protein
MCIDTSSWAGRQIDGTSQLSSEWLKTIRKDGLQEPTKVKDITTKTSFEDVSFRQAIL